MAYDYSRVEEETENKPGKENEGGKAAAEGSLIMNAAAFQAFMTGSSVGGSEAWTVARLAAIQGAKQADELILVSHSFNITGIEMEYDANEEEKKITVKCQVRTKERIGAETAALVGCGMALMVLVDSLRAIDRGLKIDGLKIVR
jgi:cyclic pyranopterin phosphate synthase